MQPGPFGPPLTIVEGNMKERPRHKATKAQEKESKMAYGGTVTLSTGVVLRVKRVPASMIELGLHRGKPPTPPVQWIEEKGREEENPTDPDYLDALGTFYREAGEKYMRALVTFGTELVLVPEGFDRPEDPGWVEYLSLFDMEIPEAGPRRYYLWARYWAMREPSDVAAVNEAIQEENAVREATVADAMRTFPGTP